MQIVNFFLYFLMVCSIVYALHNIWMSIVLKMKTKHLDKLIEELKQNLWRDD